MIDFGDCFGSLWEFEGVSRRLGHANYLDVSDVVVDFATFGFLPRPWDAPQYGPSGVVFGYYGVGRFEPDNWEPGYPNPAFSRRSERDLAWMARKLAHFDNELLWAAISEGRISQDGIDRELFRLLRGRLDKILDRFLTRLSPLAYPTTENGTLCLTDLAVTSQTRPVETRRYAARGWLGAELSPARVEDVQALGDGRVCMRLPESDGGYLIVDVAGVSPGQDLVPARVHLYALGGGQHRVVGLERPNDDDAP
jgi:hypothetical protein